MIYTCSDDRTYDDLCLFINYCLKLLDTYRFLTNSFIPEFFVEDQWNFLPAQWRLAFETFTIEDIHAFLQNKHLNHKVLPLSLLCFQRCTKIYKFQNDEHKRVEDDFMNDIKNDCEDKKEINSNKINNHTNRYVLNARKDLTITSNQTCFKPELLRLFHRNLNNHLKPKKIYEIDKLSSTINSIADHNCKLYDVGSGQGHLSRRLAFKYNFNVVSVDTNSNLLLNANQFDSKLISDFKFLNVNQKPKQIKYTLNKENYFELIKNEQDYGLIGLHSCGNLAHDLLELHKKSASKYLFLCSCCYHKTNENRYLISEYLKKCKTVLTVETRASACHNLDNFIDSFKTKSGELKVHAYRALIEYLFEMKSPDYRKKNLARVHGLSNRTFSDYFDCVTRNLIKNNEFQINQLDLNSEEIKSIIQTKLNQNLNVIIFFSLRSLLAPVTESILLVDRMLYLYEDMKITSKLIPLYDAKISPRNFVLVSCK